MLPPDMTYYQDDAVALLHADVRAGLRALPAESVQCVVTSPPYWGKRHYKTVAQVWAPSTGSGRTRRCAPTDDGVDWEDCEHVWGAELTTEGYTSRVRWQHSENGRGEEAPDDKRLRAIARVGGRSGLGGNATSQVEAKIVDVIRRETRPEAWGQVSQGQFCGRCGAWLGELGLEPTPDLYVTHLVDVLMEVFRVLRKDGTLWLNIGDTYAGSGGAHEPRLVFPQTW